MKRAVMILSASLAFTAGSPSPAPAQTPPAPDRTLAQYKDRNRVLLVFAPTAQDAAYLEQSRLWRNEHAEFDDRQLVVVPVFADAKIVEGVPPATLAKRYGLDAKTFAVVLIGKDGHDAFRALKPTRPETLYGVVDAMPQRRAEMKHSPTPAPPTPAPTPRKPDLDHDE